MVKKKHHDSKFEKKIRFIFINVLFSVTSCPLTDMTGSSTDVEKMSVMLLTTMTVVKLTTNTNSPFLMSGLPSIHLIMYGTG